MKFIAIKDYVPINSGLVLFDFQKTLIGSWEKFTILFFFFFDPVRADNLYLNISFSVLRQVKRCLYYFYE